MAKFLCTEKCVIDKIRRKVGQAYEFEKNPREDCFIPYPDDGDTELIPTSLKDAVGEDLGLTRHEYKLVLAVRDAKLSTGEIGKLVSSVNEIKTVKAKKPKAAKTKADENPPSQEDAQ